MGFNDMKIQIKDSFSTVHLVIYRFFVTVCLLVNVNVCFVINSFQNYRITDILLSLHVVFILCFALFIFSFV